MPRHGTGNFYEQITIRLPMGSLKKISKLDSKNRARFARQAILEKLQWEQKKAEATGAVQK